ncbi:MAG TPA: ABC transporter ATP-binding protein [Vicinamibacterales bacterium]|nr:ABC transporter ATP-binding protein [Vicinamibacterales bacterium]
MIKVRGLAKSYRLGAQKVAYETLRDTLAEALRAGLRRRRNGDAETLWALNDVSFDVAPGEVVGVIGRNGAGKSTLLKVLTRITEPTKGRVELYGRVGSLLEVGTGFHSELTGRENVYLNGAILGIPHREITRRFDEIVAFADVERFIDTPVKRYSSGLAMRLAFAVAAHMDSEILLIDEVLAVGDAAFQRQCLAKMRSVAGEGRTVLFVSHNFEAVRSLCTRCLLMQQGRVVLDDTPETAIERAIAQLKESGAGDFRLQIVKKNALVPQPQTLDVRATDKTPDDLITFDDDIEVTLRLDAPIAENHTFSFQVMTAAGTPIFNSFYRDDPGNPPLRAGATREVRVRIPKHFLPSGTYEAVFAYMLPNAEPFWLARERWFEVHDVRSYRNEGLTAKRTGLVSLVLPWDSSSS